MDELTLDNKKYLSSKQAAKVTGYAKDYVGQLCREGRIDARLVGRNWYVLESSILEHRFGAEDKKDEKVKAEIKPQAAWETPRYIAEPAQTVPELSPKPAEFSSEPLASPASLTPEVRSTLTDMQSAWQEWFQTQGNKEEKALPDASEMLLEDHEEPSFTPDDVPQTSQAAYNFVETEVEEEAEPIHIARIRPEPPVMRREASYTMGEPLRLQRREEAYQEAVEERPQRRSTRHIASVERPQKRNLILNALLISAAGLAIVIATLGSGAIDAWVGSGGWANPVTNFLTGTNIVDINR